MKREGEVSEGSMPDAKIKLEKEKELVLEQLSTTEAKTQAELIEALRADMHYGILLFALRALHDDGKIVEEMMDDGNFKWRKKEVR